MNRILSCYLVTHVPCESYKHPNHQSKFQSWEVPMEALASFSGLRQQSHEALPRRSQGSLTPSSELCTFRCLMGPIQPSLEMYSAEPYTLAFKDV